jgi:hypothetical protein
MVEKLKGEAESEDFILNSEGVKAREEDHQRYEEEGQR